MILLDKIEAIAPDQASLNAARKLLNRTKWPISSIAANQHFIWGECQGSGSTPYRTCVTPADLGYKCSCPSRKFPCKHSLALMWRYSEKADEFTPGETPQWVLDWSSRRRTNATTTQTSTGKSGSIHQALTEKETPKDPKAIERAAKAKIKNKQKREQLILTGLQDFQLWLADIYDLGLVHFLHDCRAQCRQAAKRLVDAKASGIASQLDELSREVVQLPEPQRPRYIFQKLSSLYLLSQAYQQQSKLPADLQHDVRRLVGWTVTRNQLMNEADAVKVSDRWRVLTLREYIQNDGLRRIETWLGCLNTQQTENNFAVLIDFYSVAVGHTHSPYLPGEILEGTIIFYPSATPLRGILVDHKIIQASNPAMLAQPLQTALSQRLNKRCKNSWLPNWPLCIANPQIQMDVQGAFYLQQGDHSIPIQNPDKTLLLPLINLRIQQASISWNGWQGDLLHADTEHGFWGLTL